MSSNVLVFSLQLRAENTIDNAASAQGATWKSSLKQVSQQKGWIATWWGRSLENPEELHVFIEWESNANAQDFMDNKIHSSILNDDDRLLECKLLSIFTVCLVPSITGACEPSPLSVSTIYIISFNDNAIPADEWTTLLIDFQHFKQCLYEFDGFVGITDGWVAAPAALASFGPATTKTLVVMMSWESLEAERRFESTASLLTSDGNGNGNKEKETIYARLFKPLLKRGEPGWIRYHVDLNFFLGE